MGKLRHREVKELVQETCYMLTDLKFTFSTDFRAGAILSLVCTMANCSPKITQVVSVGGRV